MTPGEVFQAFAGFEADYARFQVEYRKILKQTSAYGLSEAAGDARKARAIDEALKIVPLPPKPEAGSMAKPKGKPRTPKAKAPLQPPEVAIAGPQPIQVLPTYTPPDHSEQIRQQAARQDLTKRAGDSGDMREWIKWAMRWQAFAQPAPGSLVIRWDLVVENPPAPGALTMLQSAIENPVKFLDQVQKNLGKGSEMDGEMLAKESKREEDLLRRLDEVDRELVAKGRQAYA